MNDLRRLASLMQIALVAAFAMALGGAFIPGQTGTIFGGICIGILIGAPIVRVAWLTIDWARIGDRRFALLGMALLMVLATGAVISFVK
ncbi:hypothetical protein MCETE7_00129 [Acidimicrobiia bacterium]